MASYGAEVFKELPSSGLTTSMNTETIYSSETLVHNFLGERNVLKSRILYSFCEKVKVKVKQSLLRFPGSLISW
jgi:hypothetical protein